MTTMLQKMEELYYGMQALLKSARGQTLVEYALILVLIALVVIVMLGGVGKQVNTMYSTINSTL